MRQFWDRLSNREKILVALAFLIILLILGRFFVVSPIVERRAWVNSRLEIQPQLFEKQLRIVSRGAEIKAELQRVKGSLKALERSLLSGDTPSVSASALQETVRDIAAKKGTRIVSTRVLAPEQMGHFLKVAIQVQINGGLDQVVHLIKEIESSGKLLVVSEVNIRSQVSNRKRGRKVTTAAQQGLRVTLFVSGFARTQPATSERTMTPAPNV